MFGRGTSFSLSFSLSLLALFTRLWAKFKGLFTHFIVVLTHLFAYKKHFLGHCAFLKFLNALFLGFLCLSLRAVCLKTADFVILSVATQRVARRKPQQKNPQRLKENLPFMDTSLPLSMTANASLRAVFAKTADFVILSVAKNPKNLRYALFMDTSLTLSMTRFMTQRVFGMTNSGFCLRITDIFTQSLGTKFTNFTRFYGLPRSLCSLAMTARQKFKFFTQNSRHFVNSTHFINSKHFTNSIHFITLSQILSHTQGFCISLPQIFEQFLLINLVERRSYGSSWHKRQDKNSRAD